MTVSIGLTVCRETFVIGTPDFFNSFFSTVLVRLEQGRWGERFPVIMKALYAGHLEAANVEAAQAELRQIRTDLAELPASAVVWDSDHLDKQPPWGTKIAATITSMANYFCDQSATPDDGDPRVAHPRPDREVAHAWFGENSSTSRTRGGACARRDRREVEWPAGREHTGWMAGRSTPGG